MEWVISVSLVIIIVFVVFAESTIVPLLRLVVPSLRGQQLRRRIARLDHELFDHPVTSVFSYQCDYCDEIEAGVR